MNSSTPYLFSDNKESSFLDSNLHSVICHSRYDSYANSEKSEDSYMFCMQSQAHPSNEAAADSRHENNNSDDEILLKEEIAEKCLKEHWNETMLQEFPTLRSEQVNNTIYQGCSWSLTKAAGENTPLTETKDVIVTESNSILNSGKEESLLSKHCAFQHVIKAEYINAVVKDYSQKEFSKVRVYNNSV